MDSLLASQIESIAGLQAFRGLAPVMKVVSFLGSEEFFLLLLPLFYFCVNARLGLRLGLLVIAGDTLNLLLKTAFAQPRPFWIDERILPLGRDTSYGLPSSHAQNAVSVWGYLAAQANRPWAWGAAGILVVLISLSRVYLGVHFWTDILGGWLIGALFLAAFLRFQPRLEAAFEKQPLSWQAFMVSLLVALLFLVGMAARLLHSGADAPPWAGVAEEGRSLRSLVSHLGAFWGLGIGWAMALRGTGFSACGPLPLRALRFLVGMAGVAFFWRGLSLLLPVPEGAPELALRFTRYALMTWWVAYLAPQLFLKWGLAASDADLFVKR